jgi:hypothetical protein
MAPPGGGPMMGGPPGGAPPDLQAHVNKWFNLSILSLFCGCGMLGFVNIYFAHQAKQALQQGDVAGAQEKIKTARMLCIVGYVLFGLGVLGGIASAVLQFVLAAA